MEEKSLNKPKLLDVSGYNYTGKAAIIDTLSEFSSTLVYHPKDLEFLLIRMSGGLLDLHSNLYLNWSAIRSDIAIKRFRKLIKVLSSSKTSIAKPSSLFSPTGQNYNELLGKEFEALSNEYINSLSKIKSKTYWPFEDFYAGPFRSFYIKILNLFNLYQSILEPAYNPEFKELTSLYLDRVLTLNQTDEELVVTSNALEVFNPSASLDLFKNYQLIRVNRNPIDSYISSVKHLKLNKKEHEKGVGDFFDRYNHYHKISREHFKGHERCIDIDFEEYVINYPAQLEKILDFIGLNSSHHSRKGTFFNPSKDKVNLLSDFEHPELFNNYSLTLRDYRERFDT